jgi:uncharacterized membrane protein YwzB
MMEVGMMNRNREAVMNKHVQLTLLMGFVTCLMFLALSFILNYLPTLVLQVGSVTWNSGIAT